MENGTRSEMLAKEKVGKLLCKLSLPAIVAMMVHALYNVVDTIFVGKGVGTLGIGGIIIVFPIQMIIMAAGQTIGMGGASLISRRMGAGDPDGAARTFGNVLILAEILGVTFLILGLITIDPLLSLFGATEDILPYSREYFQIMLLAIPLQTFAMASNDAARAEGNAKVAMVAMMIGSGLNILLDPIFIFTLGMGIRGAATATVISIATTSLFLSCYFISGRSEIPTGFKYLRLKGTLIREILTVGSPSFVMAFAFSFTIALVNNTLRAIGGPIEIAAFGIIHRMFGFIIMPIMGLTQGMQPLVGFNYGAQQYHRVRRGVRLTGITSVVITSTGFLAVLLFPESIMRAFTNDPALMEVGKDALRYCIFGLPLAGFQIMGGGLFQALGKPIPAVILSLSRQVLILIPLMVTLPRFIGVKGVWLSFPTADVLSFVLAFSLIVWAMRRFLPAPEFSDVPIEGSRVPQAHLSSSA